LIEKTGNKELSNFLNEKGYILLSKRSPSNFDWKSSPFKKESKIKVSFVSIKFLGLPINFNEEKFFIIETEKENITYSFWVKVVNGLFSKTRFYLK
jgi:hypothetical protein